MRMIKLITTVSFIAFSASAAYADTVSAKDFVQKASIANKFEIECSKLAIVKSKNDKIKDFAEDIVEDHKEVGKELEEALSETNIGAKPATALDGKHQKLMSKLKTLSGKRFDNEYVAIQTQAHKEAVYLFGSYSKYGKDKELKEFAEENLPTLQEHLRHAQELKDNF